MEAYASNTSSDYIYHETPTTCFTVQGILRRIRMKVSEELVDMNVTLFLTKADCSWQNFIT